MATILSAPDRSQNGDGHNIYKFMLGFPFDSRVIQCLKLINHAMNELFHPLLKGAMGWEHQSQGTSGLRACEQTNLISIQFPGFWRDCLV